VLYGFVTQLLAAVYGRSGQLMHLPTLDDILSLYCRTSQAENGENENK